MEIANLLRQAADAGVFLSVQDGQLRFKLSVDHFPDALRQQIVAAKSELIAYLSRARAAEVSPHPPIQAGIAGTGDAPASFAQQRLWFLDRLDGPSHRYNMPVALRVHGQLAPDAVEAALRDLVERHEPLRTILLESTEGPRQHIAAGTEFRLARLRCDGDEAALDTVLRSEAERPFDLAADLPLRACLVGDGGDGSVLLLTLHHSAADGWSLGVLAREFTQAYAARRQGGAPQWSPLPLRYADYSCWQHQVMSAPAMSAQLAYWREQLRDLPDQWPLREDLPRARPARFRAQRSAFLLEPQVLAAARRLAQNEQVSLFMLLHAVLAVLLARQGQIDDVVIGTPVANRLQRPLEGLIGLFVNTLALRCNLQGNPGFSELLQQVRRVNLEAQANQDAPFDAVVAQLQGARRGGSQAPFQVLLSMELDTLADLDLPGAQLQRLPDGAIGSKVDLLVAAREGDDGLSLVFEYDTDVFLPATVQGLGERLLRLLRAAVAAPSTPVRQLPLLSPAEREFLLRGLNDTARDYPLQLCIHELFEQQAERTPAAPALRFDNQTVSYAELDARASRLAHWLRRRGVVPDGRVALCLERSPDLVVAILAVLKAGGAYVPLDPAYPAERLQFLLDDSQASVVLTQSSLQSRLPASAAAISTCLDTDATQWQMLPAERLPVAQLGLEPRHLAYVIYTSGSTGQPKGVMNEHAPVLNRLLWARDAYAFGPGERLLQKTPYSFDVSVGELLMPILCGATLVLAKPGGHLDPDYLARTIAAEQITMVHFVPSMLQLFLDHEVTARCASLRRVLCSGEALPYATQQRFFAALPGVTLHNLYGPTEAAIEVTSWDCRADVHAGVVPIGRPISNVNIYILDADREPVAEGVIGEIYLGGICAARGYQNRPELTAECFVRDPFAADPQARMYRTGDLGRWLADGAIEYLGRNDAQVKIRGLRIELGEIEYRLAQFPGITGATVLAREDQPGQQRLVAYVTRQGEGASGWTGELRQSLLASLPEYMVPTQIVVLDAMPLNSNGKVDRKALLARRDENTRAPIAISPRSAVEQRLAAIWQRLLQRDAVGVHDNFFEIGGNSLLSVRLRSEVMREFACDLELTDVFEHPTIARLAQHLRGDTGSLAAAARTVDSGVPIAIIGMAGRFPGARDIDAFWHNLCGGVESLREFSRDELIAAGTPEAVVDHPDFVRKGVLLEDLDQFDAGFFGLTPREAEQIDPQQRLLFECAAAALEHAGHGDTAQAQDVGVFVGMMDSVYLVENLLPALDIWSPAMTAARVANSRDFAATRLAYKLNLRGPALTLATACSTSLVAVHQACASLRLGECRMALAGAANVTQLRPRGYLYVDGDIRSRDGHCRAFDQDASGTRGGDGAGMVLLKRLDDALRDGDTIYAQILGSAINNDGADKVGYNAPSIAGQASVIGAALAAAGVAAASVHYVETHGTGTRFGDPVEIRALTRAYGRLPAASCRIGTLKPNIGHLDCAAGVAGLIKTALALHHGLLPPSIHFNTANPGIDFAAGPFSLNTQLSAWPRSDGPRRAAISAFGIGGTNAHAVLEQAPAPAARKSSAATELLLLSAEEPAALAQHCEQLAQCLAASPALALADVAATLQLGRTARRCRSALLVSSADDAVAQCARQAALDPQAELAPGQMPPPLVLLFTGQGAQYAGMGRGLYARFEEYRRCVDECCALLQPLLGLDLRTLLFAADAESAAERLQQTALAQPALFVTELALARLLMRAGIKAQAMVGHSVGEYVAAHLAGVFDLPAALRLVAARGRLMQSAPPGEMLAVSLPADQAALLAAEAGVTIACINDPAHCVLAGTHDAIAAACALLDQRGIANSRLHTSHAFHSPLMDAVLPQFRAEVAAVTLRAPTLPCLSGVSGEWLSAEQAIDPDYWVRQLREPVQFSAAVQTLLREWASAHTPLQCLELGPGRTLAQFVRRHADAGAVETLPLLRHAQSGDADDAVLLRGLAALWLRGQPLEWNALWTTPQRVALPTYPFQRQRYWMDAPAGSALPSAPQAALVRQPGWRLGPRTPEKKLAASAAPWLVFGDGASPLSADVAAALESLSARVLRVDVAAEFEQIGPWHYRVPADAAAYARLLQALAERGLLPGGILLLQPATAAADSGLAHCGASLLELGRLLGGQGAGQALPLILVTRNACRVTGSETLSPMAAALQGLGRHLARQGPALGLRCIDIEAPDAALPARLAAEALRGDTAAVALRGRQRWLGRSDAAVVATPLLPAGGHYVIACASKELALNLARQLSQLASDAEFTLLAADANDGIESTLAKTRLCRVDSCDPPALRQAFTAIFQHSGRIDGVIHAAWRPALAADTALPSALELQVDGEAIQQRLHALASVMDGQPAEFLLLLTGGDDAAAATTDAWLGGFVEAMHQSGDERWRCLHLANGFDAAGIAPAALHAALAADAPPLLLVLGEQSALAPAQPGATLYRRRQRHAAERTEPANEVERQLLANWQELLGFADIGTTDDFFELGGDSLLATRAVNFIRVSFPLADGNLSIRDFFDAPTVAAVAARITAALMDGRATDQKKRLLEQGREIEEGVL